MANHITFTETHISHTKDPLKRCHGFLKARRSSLRKIYLAQISCNNHPGIVPKTSEKHFHLDFRCVLSLIQNNNGIGKGSSTHKGERSHLNFSKGKFFRHLLKRQHIM